MTSMIAFRGLGGRIVAEPMLHFALIGFLLFGAYNWNAPPVAPAGQVIEVTPAIVDGLRNQYEAAWNRPLNDKDLDGLVNGYVREEVLYREALALGLDRNDSVIRQRLRQKIEFLSADASASVDPSEAELRAWFEANIDQFTPAPRLSFWQIPLSNPADAPYVLEALARGEDPATFGQSSILPVSMEEAEPTMIDTVFGAGFSERVVSLPVGSWQGPLSSSYGAHLTFVAEKTEATPPRFDDVKDTVLEAWRGETGEQIREVQYQALLSRYEVRRLGAEQEL